MDESTSRKLLGEFLRLRRARLSPDDVGLVSHGRRRTRGLRREEVAQLAHIGTSWYTSLEQGRNVNPSEDVLNHIATALQLNADERQHLLLLARPADQERVDPQPLPVGLERMIAALEPHPAFIMDRYWDLQLWNQAAAFVFHLPPFSDCLEEGRINWMRHLLSGARVWLETEDWEDGMQVMIAQFRADYAHFPNDARFSALIEEFSQNSPLFCELWPLHNVQIVTDRHKQRFDPRIGEMEFEHVALQPLGNPDHKIMLFSASKETAARLERALNAD
ncbi:helix-turn-helix transcriptional regulator [Paenibacillus sp. GCM10023250]|uniref:helix-turn-helix transcriptional regulator n=1 Tax=Paenibacillus sp. GCM10023250 TaxID=3252648 RepID=UPI003622B618